MIVIKAPVIRGKKHFSGFFLSLSENMQILVTLTMQELYLTIFLKQILL